MAKRTNHKRINPLVAHRNLRLENIARISKDQDLIRENARLLTEYIRQSQENQPPEGTPPDPPSTKDLTR